MNKWTLLIISVAMLLAACDNKSKKEDTIPVPAEKNTVVLTDAQYKNAGIETGKLDTRDISSVLKVNGRVDVPPQNIVSVNCTFRRLFKVSQSCAGNVCEQRSGAGCNGRPAIYTTAAGLPDSQSPVCL